MHSLWNGLHAFMNRNIFRLERSYKKTKITLKSQKHNYPPTHLKKMCDHHKISPPLSSAASRQGIVSGSQHFRQLSSIYVTAGISQSSRYSQTTVGIGIGIGYKAVNDTHTFVIQIRVLPE